MAYTRKTRGVYHVQGLYYGKWETETISDNRREALQDLKDYRENCNWPYRIVKKREILPTTNPTADAQGASCRLQEAVV